MLYVLVFAVLLETDELEAEAFTIAVAVTVLLETDELETEALTTTRSVFNIRIALRNSWRFNS
jgi:Flp pilus assembly protein CpaB